LDARSFYQQPEDWLKSDSMARMGRTKRYVIALLAWLFAGFVILPLGQWTLIAGADGKSPVTMFVGAFSILIWIAGAWFGCYKLFGGGTSEESRAGVAVKALGGMVTMMFLTTSACFIVTPMLKRKPDKDLFWKHLDRTNSFAVATFLKNDPSGPHAYETKDLLRTLEASDWNRIQAETNLQRKASELDRYLRMDRQFYPILHEREARELLDDVEWKEVLAAGSAEKGDRASAYLLLHRGGKHVREAARVAKGLAP
jgi:hypothetical protein